MKRLTIILAATAIALLTTGTTAWATDCHYYGTCPTPSPSGSVTPSPTPTPTSSPTPTPSTSPTPSGTPSPTYTAPPPTEVTATAPVLIDTCEDTPTILLPDIEGVTYTFPREDGDIWLDPGETIVIEAVSLPGYVLTGPDRRNTWTFTALTEQECAAAAGPTPTPGPSLIPVANVHTQPLPPPELAATGWGNSLAIGALIAVVAGVLLVIVGRKP